MIFSDNKITSKEILVRFYYYADTSKGWGDTGTACYEWIPIDDFVETEQSRIVDGNYYTYQLDQQVGKRILGDYWWMDYGYEIGDIEKIEKERAKAELLLRQINHVWNKDK